jgi:hypothetical protein
MIASVCVIHRENNPLLLKIFPTGEEDETKFHHMCYCALDVFEEREQAIRSASGCMRTDARAHHACTHAHTNLNTRPDVG